MTTDQNETGEFTAIFEPNEPRQLMSKPTRVLASRRFIREVQHELGISDDNKARETADWIADKMERFGARTAEAVFTFHGEGPVCSWCGQIWPLCGHHHTSEVIDEDEESTNGN